MTLLELFLLLLSRALVTNFLYPVSLAFPTSLHLAHFLIGPSPENYSKMNGSTITIGQLIHAAQLLEGNSVAIAMEPTSAFYKLGGKYLSGFQKFPACMTS